MSTSLDDSIAPSPESSHPLGGAASLGPVSPGVLALSSPSLESTDLAQDMKCKLSESKNTILELKMQLDSKMQRMELLFESNKVLKEEKNAETEALKHKVVECKEQLARLERELREKIKLKSKSLEAELKRKVKGQQKELEVLEIAKP